MLGILKLKLQEPPPLTVGCPTLWPLNVTSTVSLGWKPVPLAVTKAPGKPDVGDIANAGVVVVDAVAPGVPAPGVWPRAVAGAITRAATNMPRIRATDPIPTRRLREKPCCSIPTNSPHSNGWVIPSHKGAGGA